MDWNSNGDSANVKTGEHDRREEIMTTINRRDFLRASSAAALGFGVRAQACARAGAVAGSGWDAGSLRHLLPTVSDTRMLIKASFNAPLAAAPTLRVGNMAVRGRMSDTQGEHWHFYASGLRP